MNDYDYGKSLDINAIIHMNPLEFSEWAINMFHIEIPIDYKTLDDAPVIAETLGKCSNYYFYLCELQGQLKIQARKAGREKNKELKENITDIYTLVDEMGKGLKQQYTALSRMITVRASELDELHMTDGKIGRTFRNNGD